MAFVVPQRAESSSSGPSSAIQGASIPLDLFAPHVVVLDLIALFAARMKPHLLGLDTFESVTRIVQLLRLQVGIDVLGKLSLAAVIIPVIDNLFLFFASPSFYTA